MAINHESLTSLTGIEMVNKTIRTSLNKAFISDLKLFIIHWLIGPCTSQVIPVQTTTNMPQMCHHCRWAGKHLDESRAYRHCPLRCYCTGVERQLLPVDSPLGPPHWAAVGEKPCPGLFKATVGVSLSIWKENGNCNPHPKSFSTTF